MKSYKSYMDRITVSPALHEKLQNPVEPKKTRPPWRKYGVLAACLALVLGVGIYRVAQWHALEENFRFDSEPPMQTSSEAIDLAPEDPDYAEPGMKTLGGYEVQEQIAGVDVTTYHILPWIDYGTVSGETATAAMFDWDIPKGSTRRDLSREEIAALLGGEDVLSTHLDWDSYQLTGWAAWYEDGSFWGAYLNGWAGPLDHFEFAVTAGTLPPTCIVLPGSAEQDIWGVMVTADGFDSEAGCNRRVSFMKDGMGYRFDLTSTDTAQARFDLTGTARAEELVSRMVRQIIAEEGANPDAITADGSIPPASNNVSVDPIPSTPPSEGASAPSVPPMSVSQSPEP